MSKLAADYLQMISSKRASASTFQPTPILSEITGVLQKGSGGRDSAKSTTNISRKNIFEIHFRDFEDAIQYYAALAVKSDYFITRNKQDYPANLLKILTPDEFLALLKSESAQQNSP